MLKSVTECIPSECSKEHKRLQRDPLNHKWTVFCFFGGGVFPHGLWKSFESVGSEVQDDEREMGVMVLFARSLPASQEFLLRFVFRDCWWTLCWVLCVGNTDPATLWCIHGQISRSLRTKPTGFTEYMGGGKANQRGCTWKHRMRFWSRQIVAAGNPPRCYTLQRLCGLSRWVCFRTAGSWI